MSMMSRLGTFLAAVAFVVVMLGCASHPPKVNCEGKLRPINPPAPTVRSDAPGHED
jgi:hypothetical protein